MVHRSRRPPHLVEVRGNFSFDRIPQIIITSNQRREARVVVLVRRDRLLYT